MHADEGPRPDTSLERLAKLRPAFREGGTVTAGNSSTLNDGAACLVLASEERGRASWAREPLARIVSTGVGRRRPRLHGRRPGPRHAARRSTRAGLTVDDIDLVELNEAFASQVLACACASSASTHDKLNVNGGAIALGHPLGCSGARLLGTLAHELRRRGGRYGLADALHRRGPGPGDVVENPAA